MYVGGTEHAVGHLLYSRMWTKALYDLGHIGFDEPFKKLLNQGMIQGSSRFVYRLNASVGYESFPERVNLPTLFISKGVLDSLGNDAIRVINEYFLLLEQKRQIPRFERPAIDLPNDEESWIRRIHVDVSIVDGLELNIEEFRKRRAEAKDAVFMLEDSILLKPSDEAHGKYICGAEVEKMSKSKFNTVNPDDLVAKYGADTFRMYEMFLGPVEVSKPWDTKGIEGVHRFLKKLWRLFYDEQKGWQVTQDAARPEELKVLHKTIKKVEDDIERFNFNTVVSAFMVCVNELSDLKCRKRDILEPLVVMLASYAPHVAEELYAALGCTGSAVDAPFPVFNPGYVVESTKEYPVSINGKLRTTILLPSDADQPAAEALALSNELVQKWMEGKPLKKFIFVKRRMINIVV